MKRPALDWGPSPESGRLEDYMKAEQKMADMPPVARWQEGYTKYDVIHTINLVEVDLNPAVVPLNQAVVPLNPADVPLNQVDVDTKI